MATSGSKSVAVTSYDTLKFTWSRTDYSVAKNTSTIDWKLQLISDANGRISSSASKDWSVTVDGKTFSGTNTVGIAASTTKTLASGTKTITHNADGTKTFSYSFSQEFGITFGGSNIGTKTGESTGTLNTIPRATTPTVSASSVDMGGKVTINTPRASSSFTHDLAYAFAGASYVSIATGVGTSYSWTTPDLASKIPSATSGTVTIRCITKNGDTTIGTKTVTMTLKVPASVVPTVSSVAVVEAVAGLAAQFGALVQNKSKAKVTITGAGAKGSDITGYSATFQGHTYTASSWTSGLLTGSGTQTIKVKVKDSRGRWSAETSKTFTVLAYSPPKITAFKAARGDEAGAATSSGGLYALLTMAYSVASLGGKNTASMKVEWKKSTDTTYNSTPLLTGTALSENFTARKIASPTFSVDYQYDLLLTVTDWFGASSAATYPTILPSDAVIIDLKADGTGVGFFKTSDRAGVDFGASAKGAVLGLWEATSELPENGDFNDFLLPGVYSVPSNAIMTTLAHRPPCPLAGTLRVWSGLGAEKVSGAYAYIVQEFHSYHTNYPVYRRSLASDGTGAFYPGEWKATTLKGQKVLWDGSATENGGYYMTANHVVNLSEAVSEQDTGITLVFSQYNGTAAQDYDFVLYDVPKQMVSLHPGVGHAIPMMTGTLGYFAVKYLYINDTQIKGHDRNSQTATGACGITYTNNRFVLRYVLGR